ncbi:hypothetical protein K466DRAFT_161591 [Polyporus arcularius HHB13444]|uniref:Uncharacterized protein n=1 Tax=Polyporus arcularius HHB13444 TaxID=1314778 RepID=A0A5C3PTY9_9APHY|nr:hypothetical protein K466DRAFT_161591 [Polyporus arcularius HHB13444]
MTVSPGSLMSDCVTSLPPAASLPSRLASPWQSDSTMGPSTRSLDVVPPCALHLRVLAPPVSASSPCPFPSPVSDPLFNQSPRTHPNIAISSAPTATQPTAALSVLLLSQPQVTPVAFPRVSARVRKALRLPTRSPTCTPAFGHDDHDRRTRIHTLPLPSA